jgi:hypothetical protein
MSVCRRNPESGHSKAICASKERSQLLAQPNIESSHPASDRPRDYRRKAFTNLDEIRDVSRRTGRARNAVEAIRMVGEDKAPLRSNGGWDALISLSNQVVAEAK